MIRAAILLLLMTISADAREPYCYRGGLLCDCVTRVCEGDNFRRPLPPGSTVTIKMHRTKHHQSRSDMIRDWIDEHYPPVSFSIGARM
jgi:hypothetical protein